MIIVVACTCGSAESLARKKLREFHHPDWLNVKVYKGKDKAINALSIIPPFPEIQELKNYIEKASKFVVIVGANEEKCRWADVASPNPKEVIEAELIVQHFR